MTNRDDLEARAERLQELMEEFRTESEALRKRSVTTRRTRAAEALKQAKATIKVTERILRNFADDSSVTTYRILRRRRRQALMSVGPVRLVLRRSTRTLRSCSLAAALLSR